MITLKINYYSHLLLNSNKFFFKLLTISLFFSIYIFCLGFDNLSSPYLACEEKLNTSTTEDCLHLLDKMVDGRIKPIEDAYKERLLNAEKTISELNKLITIKNSALILGAVYLIVLFFTDTPK